MLIEEIREALPNVKIMIMVAEKYNLAFVELQNVFDKANEIKEGTYWLADGVHPTAMGHELLKREWMKAFEK